MDDLLHTTLMYDFYGGLLTERQRDFFELYFFDNLSILEIGEANGITPQAVWDILKRTLKILHKYESKLSLVSKHLSTKRRIEAIEKNFEILANETSLSEAQLNLVNSVWKEITGLADQ